jgi:hypothetical protein
MGNIKDTTFFEKMEFYNYDFTFNDADIKSLYLVSDQNLKSTKREFSSIIKKSNSIIISLGMNDILSLTSLRDGYYVIDQELKNNLLALKEYYLYHLIENIYLYNQKIKIYLLSFFNQMQLDEINHLIINQLIEEVNNILITYQEEMNYQYIDITSLSEDIIKNNELTKSGINKLVSIIKAHL